MHVADDLTVCNESEKHSMPAGNYSEVGPRPDKRSDARTKNLIS